MKRAKIKYYPVSSKPYSLYDIAEEMNVFIGYTEQECRDYARKHGYTVVE